MRDCEEKKSQIPSTKTERNTSSVSDKENNHQSKVYLYFLRDR